MSDPHVQVPVNTLTLDLLERPADERDTTPAQIASEWIERAAHEERCRLARTNAVQMATCPVCKAAPGAPCVRARKRNGTDRGPHLRRITAAREVARHGCIGGGW